MKEIKDFIFLYLMRESEERQVNYFQVQTNLMFIRQSKE